MDFRKRKSRRVRVVLCSLLSAAMLAIMFSPCYSAWGPYTPITDISITNPTANEVWLAGSDHTVTCTLGSDCDENLDTGQLKVDSVTHYWSGTGTFKGGNVGTSVTYVCTDTAVANSITAHCNDDYAPVSNTALYDETETGDTETVTVLIPQLEWVEFGGGSKHTMYKKDADPWNPANEDYTMDYATPVPNKAWVRDPALADPVSYTKATTGAQVTASINFATSQALTETSTVSIEGKEDSVQDFASTGINVSGAATTVPAMNMVAVFVDTVGGWNWQIGWSYKVPTGSDNWIALGSSQDDLYLTWGTPGGSRITAKRMNWAAYMKCDGDDTVTALGDDLSAGVNSDTTFGTDNPTNRWEALDGTKTNDCLAGSELAVSALNLLGVTDCNTQKSRARTVATDDPDYPADVTVAEYDGVPNNDSTLLWYSTDGGAADWNRYEGSFRAKDGTTWKYWAVFSVGGEERGPFIGTGTTDDEKDKSARYKVLDDLHDNTDYVQKYGQVRAAADLPQ